MKNTPDNKIPARIADLNRQRKELLTLPPGKTMQRIFESAQPAALVHSFPEQDLFFLIHDIGAEDALPLLALASDRQWEYILDIKTWYRDRLEPVALIRWFDLLYRADARRTLKWLIEQKTKLLTLFLFKNIEVRVCEHDRDPSEFGKDFFTLDSVFYVRITGPLFASDSELGDIERKNYRVFLTKLIQSLAAFDHVAYQTLLLEAAHSIPAENEEEAYRLRNVRLAEKGFLPFEEAVGVYQPLTARQLAGRNHKVLPRTEAEISAPVPFYPSGVLEGGSIFSGALATIGTEAVLEQLQTEFAGLCNRIIAADLAPVHSKDDLRAVVKKANGFLSIGLETLAAETEANGHPVSNLSAALVQRHPLSDIFRVGYGRVLELKWRVQRWLDRSWFAGQGLSLTFWGEDWLGVLGGLLVKKPMFFDNYVSGRMYRDFGTVDELRQTAAALEAVIACDHLFSLMTIPPELLSARRFLMYKNLMLTLWALDRVGCTKKNRFLTRAEFRLFFEQLWQSNDRPRRVAPAIKQSFLSWLCGLTGMRSHEITDKLGSVLESLFLEIEEEYGQVDTADLDPRFIHLFLIER
ncbi:MAG: DUF6178 family protein [Desulfobacterales bacterium]|jgi:hypothetical protein